MNQLSEIISSNFLFLYICIHSHMAWAFFFFCLFFSSFPFSFLLFIYVYFLFLFLFFFFFRAIIPSPGVSFLALASPSFFVYRQSIHIGAPSVFDRAGRCSNSPSRR